MISLGNGNVLYRMDDEVMREIGERIQMARKAASISSLELAELIGIGSNQMSRIENGKVPIKTEYLFVLPQILNVTVDYLLYGDTKSLKHKEITKTLDRLDEEQLERADIILKAAFA